MRGWSWIGVLFVASCTSSGLDFEFQTRIVETAGQDVTIDGEPAGHFVSRHFDDYAQAREDAHLPVVVSGADGTTTIDLTPGFCARAHVDVGEIFREKVFLSVSAAPSLVVESFECTGTKGAHWEAH